MAVGWNVSESVRNRMATGHHLALRVAIINSIGQANPGPRPITASRPASRTSADEVMEQLRPYVLMSQRDPTVVELHDLGDP